MGRSLWVWLLGWLVVICSAREARADEPIIAEIRVCVRPPDVPPNVQAWVYYGSTTVILKREAFREQSRGHTVYTFDPFAPPESTALLPIPYNKLPCAEKPPPAPAPPEPKKDEAPKLDPKKPGAAAPAPVTAPAAAPKKKEREPDPLPAPIVYPKKPKAPDEPHPRPPPNGVTAQWSATVLPIVRRDVDTTTRVLPQTTVLPVVHRDVDTTTRVLPQPTVLPVVRRDGGIPSGTVLPIAGRAPDSGGGEGKGSGGTAKDGTANGTGVQKTALDKVAEELAYAGAIANQQLNEDTKSPDGKRYGIPGGKNADGPNHPAAQAAAGATLVAMALVSASGLDKKLKDALTKKTPLLIQETGKAGEQATQKFIQGYMAENGGKKAGERFAHLVDAMHKNGTIGEYAVMKQFTTGLNGTMQAHHIVEKRFAKMLKIPDADTIPSVLLTEAEHKAITAALAKKTANAETPKELWKAYQEVYQDYPHWLEAIKKYFGINP